MPNDDTTHAPTIEKRFRTIYKETPDLKNWFEAKSASERVAEVLNMLEIPEEIQKKMQWDFMRASNINNHSGKSGLHANFSFKGLEFTLSACASSVDYPEAPIGSTIVLIAREVNSKNAFQNAKFIEYRTPDEDRTNLVVDIKIDDPATSFQGTLRYSWETDDIPVFRMFTAKYGHQGKLLQHFSEIDTKAGRMYLQQLLKGGHPTEIIRSRYSPHIV